MVPKSKHASSFSKTCVSPSTAEPPVCYLISVICSGLSHLFFPHMILYLKVWGWWSYCHETSNVPPLTMVSTLICRICHIHDERKNPIFCSQALYPLCGLNPFPGAAAVQVAVTHSKRSVGWPGCNTFQIHLLWKLFFQDRKTVDHYFRLAEEVDSAPFPPDSITCMKDSGLNVMQTLDPHS